jgi:Ca2+-binding EF-hand superfamily protein
MSPLRRLELRELRETFDFNDTDRDGALSFDEFVRMMMDLDPVMTSDEARIGFDEVDADHNGAISFGEFVAWWKGDDEHRLI